MRWSLLGLFLMGISFPKMWATERKWPYEARHTPDPARGFVHNCKDGFTDNFDDRKGGDREWWLKFMGFMLLALIALIVLLVLA